MGLKFGTSSVNQLIRCTTRGMCLFGKCSNFRFKTHRYFIEPISERSHLRFDLLKREIKFANTLRNNKKGTIKTVFPLLEEVTNSIIGKNLGKIMKLCGKSKLRDNTYGDLERINYNTVTNEKKWTLDLVKKPINIRKGILLVPELSREEIINILDYVCTS